MEIFLSIYFCAMVIVLLPTIAQCIEYGVKRTIEVNSNHLYISCYGDEEMGIFQAWPKTMFCVSTFLRATLPVINVVTALRMVTK